jgi:UDP-2,3-diacylglucosamine pyrophosphatase LpxH
MVVEGFAAVIEVLAAATRRGLAVTVIHGNRDFALEQRFAHRSGARVVAGGLVLRSGGRRFVLLHGDETCLNDLPYQESKRWLRANWIRLLLRHMPLALALRLARRARRKSRDGGSGHDPARYWPVADAIEAVFAGGFDGLVFGHVHVGACGRFEGLRGTGDYWMLPAFDDTGILLEVQDGVLRYHDGTGGGTAGFGPLRFPALRAGYPAPRLCTPDGDS